MSGRLDMERAMWAGDVLLSCLQEAGDDVEAGFAAAEYILDVQPVDTALLLSEDEYPRDAGNRFMSKHKLASASCNAEVEAEMLESVPDEQRSKLVRAIQHLQSGGGIHHPKEAPGLAIDKNGNIIDPMWAEYERQLADHELWTERQTHRDRCRESANSAVRDVRDCKGNMDETDASLLGAGATDAEMRTVSRMRYRVTKGQCNQESLDDLYEDVAEAVHRRLDASYESDPEVPTPKEPTNSQITSAPLAIDPATGYWHGPVPPGPNWTQIGRGPHGGIIWAPAKGSASTNAPAPPPAPRAAPKPHTAAHQAGVDKARARVADATGVYNYVMRALNKGGPLDPEEKNDLSEHLDNMDKHQLRTLHTALSGTTAVADMQRQPLIHALKGILSDAKSSESVPASESAPQLRSLVSGIREVGSALPSMMGGDRFDPAGPAWDSHKVLISDLYEGLKSKIPGLSLKGFKQQLIEAQRQRLLELHRNDLPTVHGEDSHERISQSEIAIPGTSATFHAVDIRSIKP